MKAFQKSTRNGPQNVIAFIGYRKAAIEAAERLGYSCIIWSNKAIPLKKPRHIIATHRSPFHNEALSKATKQFFDKFPVAGVIALTEAAVVPAALVMQHLKQTVNLQSTLACHDKYFMKQWAQRANIPVTNFCLITQDTDLAQLEQQFGFPIYVKLRTSSGGRGQLLAHNQQELAQFAAPERLAEKNIVGQEISVEVFIQNGEIIFLNQTEYFLQREINIIPAIQAFSKEKLVKFIQKIVSTFAVNNGMLHIELFHTQNEFILGELAARPPGGYIMDLIQLSYGFDPWEALIHIHLGEKVTLPHLATNHSSVLVIHPGQGEIKQIKNMDKVRQLPSFYSIKLKKKIGDIIKKREGAGQDVGHIILHHRNSQQLLADIEFASQYFIIEVIPNMHH